ncbi:hypothetical protein [Dokdonella soli]|uniref:Uncharacterized protein n=1 Tax=Dokdonella soli TaxID=529810 RepID=A0ABP3TUS0_9GAMM
MDHDANQTLRAVDDSRHDPIPETIADGLWLGGEAMVAPACINGLRAAERTSGDYVDPLWQVI